MTSRGETRSIALITSEDVGLLPIRNMSPSHAHTTLTTYFGISFENVTLTLLLRKRGMQHFLEVFDVR